MALSSSGSSRDIGGVVVEGELALPGWFLGSLQTKPQPEPPEEAVQEEDRALCSLQQTKGLCSGVGSTAGRGTPGTPLCEQLRCFPPRLHILPPLLAESSGVSTGRWPRRAACASTRCGPRGLREPRWGPDTQRRTVEGSGTPWGPLPRPPVGKPQLDAQAMHKLQGLKSAPSNTGQHHSLQIPASSLPKPTWTACKFNEIVVRCIQESPTV